MRKLILLMALVALVPCSALAEQSLIDFEDVVSDTQPYMVGPYRMEATNFGSIRPTTSMDGEATANTSVFPNFGFDDHALRLSRPDGRTFSLLSFQLLEPFSLATFPGPGNLHVRALREDGLELAWTVEVDAVRGVQDVFPTGLHNLLWVDFGGVDSWENVALDNVLVAESLLVYPQLALGGGFEILLFLTNRGETTFSGEASLNGGDWPADRGWILDGLVQTGNSGFAISLAPNETRRFLLSRADDVVDGWLEIRPSPGQNCAEISSSFFYNFTHDGQLLDSTGVDSASIALTARFPIERTQAIRTGFAVRRPREAVTFTLFDESGGMLQSVTAPFEGARFADEIFFGVAPGFIGSVEVASEGGFYLVVLRQELLEGGGFQLTSIPALTDP